MHLYIWRKGEKLSLYCSLSLPRLSQREAHTLSTASFPLFTSHTHRNITMCVCVCVSCGNCVWCVEWAHDTRTCPHWRKRERERERSRHVPPHLLLTLSHHKSYISNLYNLVALLFRFLSLYRSLSLSTACGRWRARGELSTAFPHTHTRN